MCETQYMIEDSIKSTNRLKHIKLTNELEEIIDGLLLGDGCLAKSKTDLGGVKYAHGDSYLEFLKWLKNYLEKKGLPINGIYGIDDNSTAYLQSPYLMELKIIREKWYNGNEKTYPKNIEFSPTKLFWWYIGDGSIHNNSGHKSSIRIDASIFVDLLPKVKEYLDNKNIKSSFNIYNSSFYSNGKRGYLYIWKEDRSDFLEYILNSGINIPSSYRYKFPKEWL